MSEALTRAIDEEKEISGYRQQNKKQKSSLFADLGTSEVINFVTKVAGYKIFLKAGQ